MIFYIVGHKIDMKKDTYWYLIYGLVFSVLAIIGKIYWGYSVAFIIVLDVVFMVASSFISPYVNTIVYNNSHKSKSPIWYQFFSETGWDIGIVLSSILIIVILTNGIDLRYSMFLGVISMALLAFTLSPLYTKVFHTKNKPNS